MTRSMMRVLIALYEGAGLETANHHGAWIRNGTPDAAFVREKVVDSLWVGKFLQRSPKGNEWVYSLSAKGREAAAAAVHAKSRKRR